MMRTHYRGNHTNERPTIQVVPIIKYINFLFKSPFILALDYLNMEISQCSTTQGSFFYVRVLPN